MNQTKPKIEYTVCEEKSGGIPVIIVAAGKATRMEGIDKQILSIGGIPVIARTLCAFQKSPFISKIILVTKKESVLKMQNICDEYFIDKLSDITVGGETRQDSVLCGIKCLDKDEEKVLIHDGARPFVNKKIIEECVVALNEFEGCVPCVKVTDTVKSANNDLTVFNTVNREKLYLAQTPQGVNVSLYLKALEELKGNVFTDDVSVLESYGKTVKIVNGDKFNIKITSREDILLANAILNVQKGE